MTLYKDQQEVWKQIPDWPYEVSNLGRCRSMERVTKGSTYKGIILKPGLEPRGKGDYKVFYHSYRMSKGNNTIKKILVYQEIAKLFIPNPEDKPHIDHIDRDPGNNLVSNLRWVTRSENELNKYSHGYRQVQSKFTPDQVRMLRKTTRSYTDIAKEYNVSISAVSEMMNYKSYKNVKD